MTPPDSSRRSSPASSAYPIGPGVPKDKRDRWGRLLVTRRSYRGPDGTTTCELELRVVTFPAREYSQRRLGAVRRDDRYGQPSAVMDLGEAVQTAVERGLPLLLSTEAAGHLADTVRVGRMKGRPGALTITSSDGLSATTRRVVAEQAISELRALKQSGVKVTLDAGARQLVRMSLARPLADDPVLLGRQQQMAALKVVGSGVDAGQVGSREDHDERASALEPGHDDPRLRAMIVAEGRLLGQWHDELTRGAPGRGLPPLAPNVEVLVIDERRPIAGQIRAFDTALGDRAGVVLVPNGVLDRYPADLQVIPWHLLIADEALRYANPATDAHQALKLVRFGSVADCWLLTATPRGKSAEHLDVLVGLAVGDEAMITERLNTREGGDLMDEINAHRLRVNYGPHLVRVTRQDMQAWMPDVRPAKPLAIDPDPALQQLLDAIRQGGREAYRRLLEVLRELKTLEAGSELFKQALAELSRAQGVVLGNVGVYVDASRGPGDADALAGGARQGARPPGARRRRDARRRRRPAAAARDHRADARRRRRRGAGDRVRRARLVPAPARPHPRRTPRRRGARRRRQVKPHEFEALKHRFTAGEFPVLCLSRIGAEGHNLQNASVIVHLDLPWLPSGLEQRVGRAARPGRRARLGADLHPLHPRRRRRAHRLGPLPPRRRAPRRARLIRGRRRQPIHHRHPARRDHRRRSPTPSKTPATPPPPPACASPPACSAPNRTGRAGPIAPPGARYLQTQQKGVAHERNRRCPVADRPGRSRGRPRPRTPRDRSSSTR